MQLLSLKTRLNTKIKITKKRTIKNTINYLGSVSMWNLHPTTQWNNFTMNHKEIQSWVSTHSSCTHCFLTPLYREILHTREDDSLSLETENLRLSLSWLTHQLSILAKQPYIHGFTSVNQPCTYNHQNRIK